MKIGNIEIKNRLVLAPMAAVNCTAFRLLCKRSGAGLIYTQMIDSDNLVERKAQEVENLLNILKEERPISVQLIGSNIKNLIKSVKMIEPYADIIDYNVGCILEDYLEKKCGGYLLKDLDKLKEIVSAIVGSTKKPVTCKIRIGWDAQNINAIKVCEILEKCGVSAIAIHGRTVGQKYGKKINWTIMKQVKEKITSIPIIANGDVTTYQEGIELLKKTGCDFVMIGREAQHSPWVFNPDFEKTNENVKNEILKFIELYEKYEKRQSLKELTQHVFWMFRNIKTRLRPQWMHECRSTQELREFLERI